MRSWSFDRPGTGLVRALAALLFLLPILWMAAAALHRPGAPLPRGPWPLSEAPTGESFRQAWNLVPFGRYTLNSLRVVILAVPLTVVVSSWAGLAMARLPRPGQRRWILVSLATLMVPGAALWPARFLIYRQLGLIDSVLALIAPAFMGTSPFYVLIFYRAFRRLPAAIYDAARIDGADLPRTWAHVALPAVRPTAIGVALLTLVSYWGDFNSPLLYITSQDGNTVPMALQLLQVLGRSDWPVLMAGALISSAIPVVAFLLFQPYFARVRE